ncbi:MAG: hypothetical protein KGH59_04275 [Candidatus Micrarchaeota archaeon]|nr:hypothetical protein [Candidatus Micrarchaeota archaeon]MDE1804968.1 hypothetical protein [Candidatus Micrarchaeota archaeon]MDE1847180.1 hypothetical protein [Candidatus Micrarchaeota archaeon]
MPKKSSSNFRATHKEMWQLHGRHLLSYIFMGVIIFLLMIIAFGLFTINGYIFFGNLRGFGGLNNFFSAAGSSISVQGNPVLLQSAIQSSLNVPQGVTVYPQNNTAVINSSSANIYFTMVPGATATTMTGMPLQTSNLTFGVFVAYGLINPTLVIKNNTTITVTEINLDPVSPHNIMIYPYSPPYPYTPYFDGGSALVLLEPTLLPPNYQSGFAGEFTETATLNKTGSLYYVSTYPNQARFGMYGHIIVN